jgi:hypothetical protein
MRPQVLKQLATDTTCGRGHDLAEHGCRDPKSGRIKCRECQRIRLEERGLTATSFNMPTELVVGLDIEADRLGLTRSKLLTVITRRWLEDQWEDRR